MKFLPQTLLGRTALLIALILVLSQVSSTLLFRFYYDGLRAQRATDQVIANLSSIEAALDSLPVETQQIFLKRLTQEQGIEFSSSGVAPMGREPGTRLLRDVSERLKLRYGEAHLGIKNIEEPVFWVRLSDPRQNYWIGMPLTGINRGFPWPRVQWLFVGSLLSLIGAYLVVRRINRPLDQLVQAAGEIGKGKMPLLPETGPAEIRRVCGAFNQMARDVQQLDKDRNLLLAGVSHDLRTPLARLRLAIELLENTSDPGLRQGMIQDIEDMDLIINQFLAYVRHGTDETSCPGDLNRLLQELAERHVEPGKKITLYLSALPAIHFKPLAMQRLLNNLLDNALLHGNSEVEIHTQALPDRAVVKVMDRGPGIPESERQRVLQPFTQLTARGEVGAGLGLAIVDRIARLHRGTISLWARDGGGLEARLELPLAP